MSGANNPIYQAALSKLYITFYDMLGVPVNASQTRIDSAYKQFQQFKERFNQSNAVIAEILGISEGDLEKLNKAFETLKDPVFREIYDNNFLVIILENRKFNDTSHMEFINLWIEEQMRNTSITDLSQRRKINVKTLEEFDSNNLAVASKNASYFNTILFLDNLESLILQIKELNVGQQERQEELDKELSNQSEESLIIIQSCIEKRFGRLTKSQIDTLTSGLDTSIDFKETIKSLILQAPMLLANIWKLSFSGVEELFSGNLKTADKAQQEIEMAKIKVATAKTDEEKNIAEAELKKVKEEVQKIIEEENMKMKAVFQKARGFSDEDYDKWVDQEVQKAFFKEKPGYIKKMDKYREELLKRIEQELAALKKAIVDTRTTINRHGETMKKCYEVYTHLMDKKILNDKLPQRDQIQHNAKSEDEEKLLIDLRNVLRSYESLIHINHNISTTSHAQIANAQKKFSDTYKIFETISKSPNPAQPSLFDSTARNIMRKTHRTTAIRLPPGTQKQF